MGSYLRTNYRITGREINADAIGGGAALGSWGGGAGTRREHGGFIMGSFNSAVLSVIHPISAYGAMSEYYGGGLFDSGYKIFPLMVRNASVPNGGTASVGYFFDATVTGSLFYVVGNKASAHLISAATQSGPVMGSPSVLASNESVHIVWAGFIASSP